MACVEYLVSLYDCFYSSHDFSQRNCIACDLILKISEINRKKCSAHDIKNEFKLHNWDHMCVRAGVKDVGRA